MKHEQIFSHKFVEYISSELEDATIYISIEFATASHRCACGCGLEVVTPFTPTDWKLIFDGDSISLDPSIGNWSFPCESHYWIRHNRIEWSRKWSKEKIDAGRAYDAVRKQQYIEDKNTGVPDKATTEEQEMIQRKGFWRTIKEWLS